MSLDVWDTAITGWAAVLVRQRARATADTYLKHVRSLAVAVADQRPWDLTSGRLELWLRGHNWSTSTRAKVLVSLRAFYAWAMDEGLCSRSPLAGITVDHRKPGPRAASPRVTAWVQAIGDYLLWLRAGGRSPGTVQLRRAHLMSLSELYADPWQVTGDDLAEWLARGDVAPEYRRSLRGTVRSFYRWGVGSRRVEENPAAELQPVGLPRVLPRPITRDALTIALQRADDRQRLILKLAAMAGLRRAEVACVHFRDIIAGQLLVHGKGGHQRLVPLHPDLVAELEQERTRRLRGEPGTGWSGPYVHAEGYLFPSSLEPAPLTPQHVGVIAQDCLPAGWTLHTLRHRFASQAYGTQRDLRAVQELLGHSRPETTARYAAVPDGAKLAAVLGAGL